MYSSKKYINISHGDIAQLARAPALQAGGQRFDPANLHQEEVSEYGPIAQLARAHD